MVKFPDKERHQVFLEPEGLDTVSASPADLDEPPGGRAGRRSFGPSPVFRAG